MPKRKLAAVEIPEDLEDLSKEALIDLVNALEEERKAGKAVKKQKKEPDANKLKKTLTKKLCAAIKKAHLKTTNAKPWVEVHEGVELEFAKKFTNDFGTQTKDTRKTWLKKLTSNEIIGLFPDLPSEHSAKWTGKDLFRRKNLKCAVLFECGEMKFDKSSNMMSVRIRLIRKPYEF